MLEVETYGWMRGRVTCGSHNICFSLSTVKGDIKVALYSFGVSVTE